MNDSNEELSWPQKQERDALLGDRTAVLAVVGALRQYRAAMKAAQRCCEVAAVGACNMSDVENPPEGE